MQLMFKYSHVTKINPSFVLTSVNTNNDLKAMTITPILDSYHSKIRDDINACTERVDETTDI